MLYAFLPYSVFSFPYGQMFKCSLVFTLTDYSEVEGGLSHAVAVLDLDGVAATVLLLSFCDGQLTAAVCA